MKVEKKGIIKEIPTESLLADYISAGWKKVKEENKKEFKEEVKIIGRK